MYTNDSYSVSDIQDYIVYTIKKHKILTIIPLIHVHINRINNRLKTPKTMKLFGSTKKLIEKSRNEENVPSLEIVEAVLVHCNLLDNQYQQKSELLYIFTPNKSYAYLLNVDPSNLVFLKTYNTEFDEIIIKLQIKMVDH